MRMLFPIVALGVIFVVVVTVGCQKSEDQAASFRLYDVSNPKKIVFYGPTETRVWENPLGVDIRRENKIYVTSKDNQTSLILNNVIIDFPSSPAQLPSNEGR